MINMTLKDYQTRTLDELRQYLEALKEAQGEYEQILGAMLLDKKESTMQHPCLPPGGFFPQSHILRVPQQFFCPNLWHNLNLPLYCHSKRYEE